MVTIKKQIIASLILSLSLPVGQLEADDPYDRETAYIGIMSRMMFAENIVDTRIATEMLFLDFMKNIGKKGIFIDVESTRDAVREMQQHKLDAVLTNTLDYLEIDHMMDTEHCYSVVIGSDKTQRVILLTRKSDGITELGQLKRKHLAYSSGLSIGRMFLDVSLMSRGLPVTEDFFDTVSVQDDAYAAIIDLFFNKSDVALVTDTAFQIAVELNPQIEQALNILITSEPMIPMVIAVNRAVPGDLTDKIDTMTSRLHEYPRTMHLLKLFKASGIEKISDKELYSARALKQQYDALKKQRQ